jgi:hypothetical protein
MQACIYFSENGKYTENFMQLIFGSFRFLTLTEMQDKVRAIFHSLRVHLINDSGR